MKMRKFAALMLTLCMMLSLSISAFAASDTIASGTIPDSKIKWELDSHGWLPFPAAAKRRCSKARTTSRGGNIGSKSRKSGMTIWKR